MQTHTFNNQNMLAMNIFTMNHFKCSLQVCNSMFGVDRKAIMQRSCMYFARDLMLISSHVKVEYF